MINNRSPTRWRPLGHDNAVARGLPRSVGRQASRTVGHVHSNPPAMARGELDIQICRWEGAAWVLSLSPLITVSERLRGATCQ